MKIYPLLLLMLTAAVLRGQNGAETPQQPPAAAVSKNDAPAAIAILQKPYNAALAAIAADNQKRIEGLDSLYLANLEKMQADFSKAGNLESAVAVKEERERIAAHRETTEEQRKAMPATLSALRGAYDASLKKIAAAVVQKKIQEGGNYQAGLIALQKRITTSGDLDQALLVKAENERIGAEIAAITPPPAPAPTPSTPVASANIKPEVDDTKERELAKVLIGAWHFTYNGGWTGKRTFSKDGTFVGEGFGGTGRWEVVGNKIALHYPTRDRNVEEMPLPLDPKGTNVAHPGSVVTAVKR